MPWEGVIKHGRPTSSKPFTKLVSGEDASEVQRVVVDASVLLAFIVDRDEKQRAAAKALLLRAAEGELVAIVPQFVIFEVVYVLQSTYRIPTNKLNPMMRDLITAWRSADR
jgi:predicted nucleic acid-binding protein